MVAGRNHVVTYIQWCVVLIFGEQSSRKLALVSKELFEELTVDVAWNSGESMLGIFALSKVCAANKKSLSIKIALDKNQLGKKKGKSKEYYLFKWAQDRQTTTHIAVASQMITRRTHNISVECRNHS